MQNNQQAGFTLLELMIALVLGLLIVAAGLAVFLSGQRSSILQNGMSELQNNANFGLAMMTHDLRHTNLNTPSTQKVNNKEVGSGVIFGTANLPSSLSDVNVNFFTRQGNSVGATAVNSDQLTIQYVPEYKKVTRNVCPSTTPDCAATEKEEAVTYEFDGVDCEGNVLKFSEVRTIVQRYHLKPDSSQVTGQPTAYSLYCDAGSYKEGDTVITGMSSVTANGQQLMQRVDAFKVRLVVKDPNKKMRYMTINEYQASMSASVTNKNNFNNVVAVEVGALVRSTFPMASEELIDPTRTFDMLGETLQLRDAQQNGGRYLREVFSQVVAFRNTLGAS